MQLNHLKELIIGDLQIKFPIIQGGMGVGISLAGLASAVANQGGVGVIAAAAIGMSEPDFATNFLEANMRALKKEIQKARQLTQGIIGVNIMVALSNFSDLVKTAIEEKVDIIFSGAGLPLNLPQFLDKSSKTKLVPIVSSTRAAKVILKRWMEKFNYAPDAIVVEGPMAGGHLGFNAEQIDNPDYALEKILPELVDELADSKTKYGKTIPVIAAGGIYTGADMHRMMTLGAAGVQMATRFITTDECDADLEFKKTFLNSKPEDLRIIKSPVGMLGRAIRNQFVKDVEEGKTKPFKCPFHCITSCDYQKSPFCIARALINAQRGKLRHGLIFSGVNGYRARQIVSVKEVFRALMQEYQLAL